MTDSPPTCADWTTPALDGVDYAVAFNDTAADRFAETHCPGGELREFEPCAATGGVVAQSRANQTVVVAAAFDVTARSAAATRRRRTSTGASTGASPRLTFLGCTDAS
ncbi:hypothetical protein ACFQJD_02770 [Haloplanus sp. GCM10025708]|uniref:DUF7261 family protein n=1 Tax=Haloplanus sp. GCM10025708 TaxID=3252679 RepID=UPI00361181AF